MYEMEYKPIFWSCIMLQAVDNFVQGAKVVNSLFSSRSKKLYLQFLFVGITFSCVYIATVCIIYQDLFGMLVALGIGSIFQLILLFLLSQDKDNLLIKFLISMW
jgi:hypothetical protein